MSLQGTTADRVPRLAGTFLGVSVNALHRVACTVGHALCGLRGHDDVLHFEPTRLSLRCLQCGRQTPGSVLDVRRPTLVRAIALRTTQSGVSRPAVSKPAVSTPAVSTPAVSTPAVSTPAVSTPAVSTPRAA